MEFIKHLEHGFCDWCLDNGFLQKEKPKWWGALGSQQAVSKVREWNPPILVFGSPLLYALLSSQQAVQPLIINYPIIESSSWARIGTISSPIQHHDLYIDIPIFQPQQPQSVKRSPEQASIVFTGYKIYHCGHHLKMPCTSFRSSLSNFHSSWGKLAKLQKSTSSFICPCWLTIRFIYRHV